MERDLDQTSRCRASRRLFGLPQKGSAHTDNGQRTTDNGRRTTDDDQRPFINKDGNMLDPVLQCEWLQDAVNPMSTGENQQS